MAKWRRHQSASESQRDESNLAYEISRRGGWKVGRWAGALCLHLCTSSLPPACLPACYSLLPTLSNVFNEI